MEKNIVIQVIGPCRIGKTTVVEMIKELFDLYGIKTEIIDPDIESTEEGKRREGKEGKRDRTISVINSLDKITIEEVQPMKGFRGNIMNTLTHSIHSEPLDIFN